MYVIDFVQLISEQAHVTNTSDSIIDVIFVNNQSIIHESVVLIDIDFTNDFAIYCKLRFHFKKRGSSYLTYRDFRNFSLNDFLKDLGEVPWDEILHIRDIEEKYYY